MRAIELTGYGGADVLEPVERERPEPDEGEVLVAVEAAGLNFADVMARRGLYPGTPDTPYVPGMEAAGRVVAAPGTDHEAGDRVVAMVGHGGYAEYVLAEPTALFPVPEGMAFAEAAGFPVQYLTAHCCLFAWGGLDADERVLVHAAAGGVGTAAVQLASRAGAAVFGTASRAEKLELAAELGCDHPLNYEEADFADRVAELTDGAGVDLVLDGVGGETFDRSLDALAHFGRVVAYGVASGVPPSVETPELLFSNHSVLGFHLGRAIERDPDRVLAAVPDLREGLASGDLSVVVGERFPLSAAADAHSHLEGRGSVGKVVLEP
jgi:NADPH2:quinone reductase